MRAAGFSRLQTTVKHAELNGVPTKFAISQSCFLNGAEQTGHNWDMPNLLAVPER